MDHYKSTLHTHQQIVTKLIQTNIYLQVSFPCMNTAITATSEVISLQQ